MRGDGTVNFSFVIPTFNRASLVLQTIRSALDWLEGQEDGEIIVVDDASTDGTVACILQVFSAEMASGKLKLLQQTQNLGVIKAKNLGGDAACGQWIIFLDSDDLMARGTQGAMRMAFIEFAHVPALFFRCEELENSKLIGAAQSVVNELTLRSYLNFSAHAECLPVIRKDIFRRYRYDESLNGWEGITYARILRDVGAFNVIPIIARRYRTTGDDRLSSRQGLRQRAESMSRGSSIILREFFPYLTFQRKVGQITRMAYYWLRARQALSLQRWFFGRH
jgi:glycosyltransferase involved in cell wall biosynthesis